MFIDSFSIRRCINFLKGGYAFLAGKTHVPAAPSVLKAEISGVCNLKCSGCQLGSDPRAGTEKAREKVFMDIGVFQKAMDLFGKDLFVAYLYHKGEPLLNKNLPEYIAIAKENNVSTVISTNLSVKLTDKEIKDLVRSGLTYLIASIDGATQEVYEMNRVGGDLRLVLSNLKKIIETKKELKSKTPVVNFQYLLFEHNRHQLDRARTMAGELGADLFTRKTANPLLGNSANVFHDPVPGRKFPFRCPWLWHITVVCADGTVLPCCFYDWFEKPEHFRVNIMDHQRSGDVWNHPAYVSNRKIVTDKKYFAANKERSFCGSCPLVKVFKPSNGSHV